MKRGLLIAGAALLLLAGCGSDETDMPATTPTRPMLRPLQRVVTLAPGDRATIPAAGVTCRDGHEAGAESLSCTRIGGGRNEVVFYPGMVLVRRGSKHADSYGWDGEQRVSPSRPRDRVFVLRPKEFGKGDRLNAPAAGTTCAVTRTEGVTELACMPMGGGRYRVSIFRPLVLVWDVRGGRGSPFAEYHWAPTA